MDRIKLTNHVGPDKVCYSHPHIHASLCGNSLAIHPNESTEDKVTCRHCIKMVKDIKQVSFYTMDKDTRMSVHPF